MKILITGSRNWPPSKRGPIEAFMRGMMLANPDNEFVFGDCPTGVDAIALDVAEKNCMNYKKFDAPWDRWQALGLPYRNAAGPYRNGDMVRYCAKSDEPAICFAYRMRGISDGTDDCRKQAKEAGFPVYLIQFD